MTEPQKTVIARMKEIVNRRVDITNMKLEKKGYKHRYATRNWEVEEIIEDYLVCVSFTFGTALNGSMNDEVSQDRHNYFIGKRGGMRGEKRSFSGRVAKYRGGNNIMSYLNQLG